MRRKERLNANTFDRNHVWPESTPADYMPQIGGLSLSPVIIFLGFAIFGLTFSATTDSNLAAQVVREIKENKELGRITALILGKVP